MASLYTLTQYAPTVAKKATKSLPPLIEYPTAFIGKLHYMWRHINTQKERTEHFSAFFIGCLTHAMLKDSLILKVAARCILICRRIMEVLQEKQRAYLCLCNLFTYSPHPSPPPKPYPLESKFLSPGLAYRINHLKNQMI